MSPFNAAQRATPAALADVVIPPGGGIPSASQAESAGQWLNAALATVPEVSAPLLAVADEAGSEEPAAETARLKASGPLGCDLLCTVFAAAHFLNPAVRRAIGYPGRDFANAQRTTASCTRSSASAT